MALTSPMMSEKMKTALLHWFNTVGGVGCGGAIVGSMSDLWQEHVPALLLYLKSECSCLKGAKGASALSVYEEALTFMMSSTESKTMASYLNAIEAANGNELEISKFLLLFWHEICISDSKTIENSISFMEQVNLQNTMGDAIEWMNKATENQDYSRWFHVLFDSPVEESEENVEEAGDARTPVNADESIERIGEDVFVFNTPSNIPARHSLYDRDLPSSYLLATPRLSARRQLPVPNSEPRQFTVPHLPFSRGSPIAEQLNSPVMREKRREREMRTLQSKLSAALEERDMREIEVKELKKQIHDEFESNHQLKSKFEDVSRDLTKESSMREQAESEVEGLRKEKSALSARLDQQCTLVKKLKYDSDMAQDESNRLNGKIEELERQLAEQKREMTDLGDEMESMTRQMSEARGAEKKLEELCENMKKERIRMIEEMEEMKKDCKRRMMEMEEERQDIEMRHSEAMGIMNGRVMDSEREVMEVKEELEKEKMKNEELRKKTEEEMRGLREETSNEKRKMIEEMREKKEKWNELEEEREKMDREKEEEMRELRKKNYDMDVATMGMEGQIMSIKQKLSSATTNSEMLTQKVDELKAKNEAANRLNGQLKETMEEMEKEREEREAELTRLRGVEEANEKMKEHIEKLAKENTESKEKVYTALLENDRFTAMMETMKKEEDDRRKEEDWHVTQLNADIVTANREKERAADDLRKMEKGMEEERKECEEERKKWEEERKEWEEEKKKIEEKKKETMESYGKLDEEAKNQKFINKNLKKEMVGLKREIESMEELKKMNEEMKEEIERHKMEMKAVTDSGRENMENVVGKKKMLEGELEKKEKMIEKLNGEITRMKEERDLSMRDTSMTSLATMKRDMTGNYLPANPLLDFDEEPTQLESKSNLGNKKGYVEVDNTLTHSDVMERMTEDEDKENDTLNMMTPSLRRNELGPFDSNARLATIARRNAQTLPHLRSSHAVESMSPNFSQEGLKNGVVRPASTKKLGSMGSALKKAFTNKK